MESKLLTLILGTYTDKLAHVDGAASGGVAA